ncbi:MAG: Holliday junction resolvase RuvX [Paraprevotella sp.]|nr:Holliday junction resolvase RuvX [Paraprevotella sp.]
MGRILSIDYGKKRTGIAVTDPLQLIANGLTTVPTASLLSFLTDYLRKEKVERFVVGKPMQTTGAESENMARVRSFVQSLQKNWPDIPVDLFDERYTSVLAHQAMLDGGLGKKARRDKALVDEISATIILQGWMEAHRTRGL